MQLNPSLLNSLLNDVDLQAIDHHLQSIDAIISGKVIELTPEQRRNFGAVDEQNKLIINKVLSVVENYPNLLPEGVDWQKFKTEAQLRAMLESVIIKLRDKLYTLESAKIMHDNNNLQASYAFYRYLEYLASVRQGDVSVLHTEFKSLFKKYGTGAIRAAKKRAENKEKDNKDNQ